MAAKWYSIHSCGEADPTIMLPKRPRSSWRSVVNATAGSGRSSMGQHSCSTHTQASVANAASDPGGGAFGSVTRLLRDGRRGTAGNFVRAAVTARATLRATWRARLAALVLVLVLAPLLAPLLDLPRRMAWWAA